MSKPFKAITPGCPQIVIPKRYSLKSLVKPCRPKNRNSATNRIISNFYHLTYDATQKADDDAPPVIIQSRDQATSTDDLPRTPVKSPPMDAIRNTQQPQTKSIDPSTARLYIRIKKSLLRKMLQKIRHLNAQLKEVMVPDTPE